MRESDDRVERMRVERMADSGLQEARQMRRVTLRNIPSKLYLDAPPPTATLVHTCRVCRWVNYGWCALSDPRFVVGLCLNCYGKELGEKAWAAPY